MLKIPPYTLFLCRFVCVCVLHEWTQATDCPNSMLTNEIKQDLPRGALLVFGDTGNMNTGDFDQVLILSGVQVGSGVAGIQRPFPIFPKTTV